jgi:hypothetical protein
MGWGWQPRQVVEWRGNQSFSVVVIRELTRFSDDDDRDGPRNVGLLAI